MTTIDVRGEPEVVVADAVSAIMPSIAAIAGSCGAVVSLAILLVVQDWLANAFAGATTDAAIGEWVRSHEKDALGLADQANMVLKLRAVGAAGSA